MRAADQLGRLTIDPGRFARIRANLLACQSLIPLHCRRLHPRVPGAGVDTSISGRRVARELDAMVAARGKPLMIVSDNGTELLRTPSCAGSRNAALDGTTSPPESRSRTPLSKASTAASGTSASTNTSSGACQWRSGSSKHGAAISRRPRVPVPAAPSSSCRMAEEAGRDPRSIVGDAGRRAGGS